MKAPGPVAVYPEGKEGEEPPPQELTWDSPIKDLFLNSYNFSDELLQSPPRLIRMYEDRWQINWQLSGLPDPEAQTILDVYLTVRPVAPATIEIKV